MNKYLGWWGNSQYFLSQGQRGVLSFFRFLELLPHKVDTSPDEGCFLKPVTLSNLEWVSYEKSVQCYTVSKIPTEKKEHTELPTYVIVFGGKIFEKLLGEMRSRGWGLHDWICVLYGKSRRNGGSCAMRGHNDGESPPQRQEKGPHWGWNM